MTAERQEVKYLVAAEHARTLAAELARRLPSHRYTGEGANALPAARHFVTTIYFDTPARDLYRAATASEDSLKLRAKEYYDLHPHLAEHATDARQLVRYHPVLWLELKHRHGEHTGKRRIGIPKKDVPGFFAHGAITAEMVSLQEEAYGGEAAAVLHQVAELCARFDGPLGADCLVNYRRSARQDEAGELRITLDAELAFYRPPEDLWTREHALVRETLGRAAGSESRRVLEVKARTAVPGWLAGLLADVHAEQVSFSKFERAARAIHG